MNCSRQVRYVIPHSYRTLGSQVLLRYSTLLMVEPPVISTNRNFTEKLEATLGKYLTLL